jgi:hypothetical protein
MNKLYNLDKLISIEIQDKKKINLDRYHYDILPNKTQEILNENNNLLFEDDKIYIKPFIKFTFYNNIEEIMYYNTLSEAEDYLKYLIKEKNIIKLEKYLVI